MPDFFKLTFFVGALASILESWEVRVRSVTRSRGYHGVGPTLDDRVVKKSKVLPDPVSREEMEH